MDLFRQTIHSRHSCHHRPYRHLATQSCAQGTHQCREGRLYLHQSSRNLHQRLHHSHHRFHSTIQLILGYGRNRCRRNPGTSSIRHHHHRDLHRLDRKRKPELHHHHPFHPRRYLDCSNRYFVRGILPSQSSDRYQNRGP